MLLVRQFDERAGFLRWGLDTCAGWLAWRCDLSLITAKEKIRVTNQDNEQNLLDFALRTTASNVAQRCRELRMRNDNYLVTIHVDQSALQGKTGRSSLPIESVKRLCCDSHAVVLIETEKGEPHNN